MSSGPTPKRRRRPSRCDATQRVDASVPAVNLGHLTHTASANTVWDVRVGWFRFTQDISPDLGRPERSRTASTSPDTFWSGGPQQIGAAQHLRTTVKATLSHHRAGWFGADHEWRIGVEVDRGEHRAASVLPTLCELCLHGWSLVAAHAADRPSNSGGRFVTAAAFVSDAIQLGGRVTINPGLRFDHSRAISQDVPEFDLLVHETGQIIDGLGTVDTWNIVSPRLGVVIKLDTAGRAMLRANAGRFSQGVLTGEISTIHPGRPRITIVREPFGYGVCA